MEFINRVRVELLDEHRAFHVFATSLGREGMFLRSNDPLPLGKKVALEFDSPHGTVRVDEGEVTWVKPPEPINTDGVPSGMDIAFCRLTTAARALIDALVGPALGPAGAAQAARPTPPATARTGTIQQSPMESGAASSELADLFLQKPEVASMNAKEQLDTSTPVDLIPRTEANFLLSAPPPAKRRVMLLLGYVVIVLAVTSLAMYIFQPGQRILPFGPFGEQGAPKAAPSDFGQPLRAVSGEPQGAKPVVPAPGTAASAEPSAGADARPPAAAPQAKQEAPPPSASAPDEPLRVATITAEPARAEPRAKPAVEASPADEDAAVDEEEASTPMPQFRESQDGWEMSLGFDRDVKIKHFALSGPPRLVIDVFGTSLAGKKALTVTAPTPFISQVRVGQAEDHVRFVLDFEGDKIPHHEAKVQANRLQITFTP